MTDEIENDVVSREFWETRKLEIEELGRLGSDAHEHGPAEVLDPGDLQAVESAIDSEMDSGTYDSRVSDLINSLTLRQAESAFLQAKDDGRSIPWLIGALECKYPVVRRFAAERLSEANDMQALQPLIGALHDEDTCVRAEVVDALVNLGDSRAVPYLIDSLSDESHHIRILAVRALVNLGDVKAVPSLIDVLRDDCDEIYGEDECHEFQSAVVKALGQLGDDSVIPHLIDMLDATENVIDSLGKLDRDRCCAWAHRRSE